MLGEWQPYSLSQPQFMSCDFQDKVNPLDPCTLVHTQGEGLGNLLRAGELHGSMPANFCQLKKLHPGNTNLET